MKYERLTDRKIAEMLRNTEGESWDSDNIEAQCYIRLAELEDKIENGEIDYAADRGKQIARLTAENAELHARLDKAVELPIKVGDTVYFIPASISKTSEFFIVEWKIESIIIMEKGYTLNCVDSKKHHCHMFDCFFGIYWFTDRTKAEARLAELKGGEQE